MLESVTWVPTDGLIHGRITHKFLPLKKHPKIGLYNDCYANLYPGDEVYVFEETKDGKWCRGYILWQPLPEDFISSLGSYCEKLPGQKVKRAIFPRRVSRLYYNEQVTNFPFLSNPQQSQFEKMNHNKELPCLYQMTGEWSKDDAMEFSGSISKKICPPFPYFRLKDQDFIREMAPMLSQLVSHVFSMYSFGAFETADSLSQLYHELDDIRIKLEFRLTTKFEYEELLKEASSLTYKIAKFISNRGMRNFFITESSTIVDSSGYGSILCRDLDTGELYKYEDTPPLLLANVTMLCSLATNFPSASRYRLKLAPPKNTNYDSLERTSLLVDFKDAISDPTVNPNFQRLSAVMYLRTPKKILTEPFVLNMDRDEVVSVENISAALFNDIPVVEVDRSKIYLVVVLKETIKVELVSNNSKDVKKTFIPFQASSETRLPHINRGLAAGVVDVSRIFTRKMNGLAAKSCDFQVELYGSHYSKASQPSAVPSLLNIAQGGYGNGRKGGDNQGWGELIDRIINNSNKGVAVNPRALSLSVTVREVLGDAASSKLLKNNLSAIQSISTAFFDTQAEPDDRIYLTLKKVSISNINALETNVDSISIQISSANDKVTFRRGATDKPHRRWLFVSVRPGESVGEMIRVDGLEDMVNDETLRISAYLNGLLLAKSKFCIKKNENFIDYPAKTVFQLISSQGEPLVDLELSTEYVGKSFNVDHTIREFLKLSRESFTSDDEFESTCEKLMSKLKSLSHSQLTQNFDAILTKILNVNFYASGLSLSQSFKDSAFFSLIHFFDMIIARQESYRHLFHDFVRNNERKFTIPFIGPYILSFASRLFANSAEEWSQHGRALCRVCVFILKLSIFAASEQSIELLQAIDQFFKGIAYFFSCTKESFLVDQVLILDGFDVLLLSISKIIDSKKLIEYACIFFQACHDKERSLGMFRRSISAKEQKFVAYKLILLRRLLTDSELEFMTETANSEDEKVQFVSKIVEWSFEPFFSYNGESLDLPTIRLANGVLITVIQKSGGLVCRNLIRLLPTLCRFLILVRKFCKEKELFKAKRTFTKLFPVNFPFDEITVDSIVQEETVVEVLIELATIIANVTKIAEGSKGELITFKQVMSQCANDAHFKSVFYISRFAREDLLTIIHTVKLILKGRFFPSKKWVTLNELFMRSSLNLLAMCKDIMIESYIPPPGAFGEFDVKLWCEYTRTALVLGNHIPHNPLSLAELPRKAIHYMAGNFRLLACSIIEDCWDALGADTSETEIFDRFGLTRAGGFQNLLVRAEKLFVRDIMEFVFQNHTDARRVGAKLIFGLTVNCWMAFGTLEPVMALTTSEVCFAYQSGKFVPTYYGTENYLKSLLFTVHLRRDDPLLDSLMKVLRLARDLLFILAESSEIPDDKEFDDDRTAHQIAVFGYLLKINKPEEFHRLVNDLFVFNIRKKDYVQAALCLELLARTYNWNPNDTLPSTSYPPLPEQSSFERREYLYKEAARNFYRGLKLEKALSIYKELAQAYEKINYDLNGLALVHGQISRLYTDLQTVDRLVPTYFKVTLAGFGFPSSLRDKSFIYEGLPFEHISSMQHRISVSHPGSRLIKTQEEMDSLRVNPAMGKFIYIIAVEPRVEISDEFTSNGKKNSANNKIRMYVENRDLNTFCSFRMLSGASNATDLWVKEVTFETASTFPTMMNRSEVKKISERTLSPVQNAIRSMQLKIQDLAGLEDTCIKLLKENGDYASAFAELSRNISGTIDAPVNGGVAQYRDFFSLENTKDVKTSELNLLQSTFDELAVVLNGCLVLHGRMCQKRLQKSHDMLVDLFQKNFNDEIDRNSITVGETDHELISRVTTGTTSNSQAPLDNQDMISAPKAPFSSTASVHSAESSTSKASSERAASTVVSQQSSNTNASTRNSTHSSKMSIFRKPLNNKFLKSAKSKASSK
ncbi:LAMI_0H01970g1_1 [Lachancea mirantina]|uniref:LAMI_0H01970g1_1 n=1 Tax=Lachancea mirantina TaxID=1230905 RepID=A0A1G4KE17_9SACH|nr:LAMI_0H01970g1_1 [Lachancea mirantina]